MFCQLAHADSLREICNGLVCCLGKLVHLGIDVAPSKSTLSYANQHRPANLYEELFYTALARFRDEKGLGRRAIWESDIHDAWRKAHLRDCVYSL